MFEIEYRKAGLADVQLLVDTRIDFLTEYWGEQRETDEKNLRLALNDFFEQEISANSYVSWLAIDNENYIGAGGMKITQRPGSFKVPDGWCGYIMNIYTKPDFRRMGIAKTILNKLIETGKEMGIHYFELHATKEGEPVYIKHGFKIHNEPTYRFFI
jgi:ribosomal protein S18 acetylase RimI-like enzyme